jgi:hypothetical protein
MLKFSRVHPKSKHGIDVQLMRDETKCTGHVLQQAEIIVVDCFLVQFLRVINLFFYT